MIDLPYSLVIEATADPAYFGFYSVDLPGFSGMGHSIEDCMYKARTGMNEHISILNGKGMPIPPKTRSPQITIQNESTLKATA